MVIFLLKKGKATPEVVNSSDLVCRHHKRFYASRLVRYKAGL